MSSIPRKHFTLKDSVCSAGTYWDIPMRVCVSFESTAPVPEVSITFGEETITSASEFQQLHQISIVGNLITDTEKSNSYG